MGALGFFLAVVACAIIVKLSNWWDNRKEEKERQRIITMNQDAAARQIMNQKEHETCFWKLCQR